jgi:hypothetical protein
MRRLFSTLTVIAIVSSALAFKAKPLGGLYCASVTQNVGCQIVHKKETTGTANFYINKSWDCTSCPSNNCSVLVRLVDEN